jgi:hypothetical protein
VAFSQGVVIEALKRADGRCECQRGRPAWSGSVWDGAWEAHPRISLKEDWADGLANCEILCWQCHVAALVGLVYGSRADA